MSRHLVALVIAFAAAAAVAAPPVPSAKLPSGQTTTRFRANWNLSTGATGYRLDVSTSPTFATFVGAYNNYDCGNRDTTRVTGLVTRTRYYYRVRAYDGTGSSASSNVRSAFTLPYTTWNGAAWSNNVPALARPAVVDSFLTLAANYTTGRLQVNPGAVLTIDTSRYFRVDTAINLEGNLVVASKGTKSGTLYGTAATFTFNGGSIQIQRNLSANRWHLVSSPVTSATAALFTSAYLRTYSEPTNVFSAYITNAATPLPPTVGYGAWSNTDRVITFTGVPNTGNKTVAITYGGLATLGYNLVGNPYASALDWRAAGWTRTGVSTTMWQWVHASGNYGTMTTTGTTTLGVTRYIPMGQGFFVRATAANPVLMIPFTARSIAAAALSQGYYKAQDSLDDTLPDLFEGAALHLVVSGDSSYQDEAAVHFDAAGADSYNPDLDAPKLMGDIAAPQLYTHAAGESYTYKTLAWPSGELRVPLSFKAGTASLNYTITGKGDIGARLVDLKLGSSVDMADGLVYSFTADTTDATARFELVFDGAAMVRGHASAARATFGVALRGRMLQFAAGELAAEVAVFAVDGSRVMRVAGPVRQVSMAGLAPGSYVCRVLGADGAAVVVPVALK